MNVSGPTSQACCLWCSRHSAQGEHFGVAPRDRQSEDFGVAPEGWSTRRFTSREPSAPRLKSVALLAG